jgi:hypothetical protein
MPNAWIGMIELKELARKATQVVLEVTAMAMADLLKE